MRIVVDGNDGTGKSTLVESLRKFGFEVLDRGIPTKLTDSQDTRLSEPDDTMYIFLDAPEQISQQRLLAAGRDLTEKYHTMEDLTHYRKRFLSVFDDMKLQGYTCFLIDANASKEVVLDRVIEVIKQNNVQ